MDNGEKADTQNGSRNNQRPNKPNVLIVGADSQIGSALKDHLIQKDIVVFGTTRKKETANEIIYYLDLENPEFDALNEKFDSVVVCAATTSIAKCEEAPQKYKNINVTNTIKLIDKLAANGSFVIYLSSNAVFDGKKPFYKNTDKTCPVTLYGKFKNEVEEHLTNNLADRSCVLRLTKVITQNTPFIERWKSDSNNGLKIKTYVNKLLSPIHIDDVIETIQLLIQKKSKGIYHLGGDEEISYTEYAKLLFKDRPLALDLISAEVEPSINDQLTHNSLMTQLPIKNSGKVSYSFEGSDLIVTSLLRDVQQGLYIDVGANHPERQNNTNYFYQQGWNGLAIDGNEEFQRLWLQQRPRDVFITTLVSDVVKAVEFAIYPDNTISSMDASAIERYSSRYKEEEIVKIIKTTTTLFDLKNQYFENFEIHLLSIDVEGEDLNCLLGANLNVWKPGVIVIETKNLSLYDVSSNDIVGYLTSVGYRLIAKTPLDAFFVYPEKSYLQWIPKSIL